MKDLTTFSITHLPLLPGPVIFISGKLNHINLSIKLVQSAIWNEKNIQKIFCRNCWLSKGYLSLFSWTGLVFSYYHGLIYIFYYHGLVLCFLIIMDWSSIFLLSRTNLHFYYHGLVLSFFIVMNWCTVFLNVIDWCTVFLLSWTGLQVFVIDWSILYLLCWTDLRFFLVSWS